jgi:rod shape-determining protein MreD
VRPAAVLAGVLAALALQTTVAPFVFSRGGSIDLVLVVVVWTALQFGPTAGLLTGMAAGLAQDALSGGIIGVGGFGKTLVGFMAGVFGSQFIVAHALPRFVVLFVGAAVNAFCVLGMYTVIERRGYAVPWRQAGVQALTTALVGIVLIQAALAVPGMLMRRRRLRRGY